MAISFIGAAEKHDNGGPDGFTIDKPAGAATGDLLIALVSASGGVTMSAPAGWTVVRNETPTASMRVMVLTRVVQGGDPTSWDGVITGSPNSDGYSLSVAAYRGVASTFPAENTSNGADPGANTLATATVSNTDANNWRIVLSSSVSLDEASATCAGMTERADDTVVRETNCANTQIYDSNGGIATGDTSATVTWSHDFQHAWSWIAILDDSSSSGGTPIAGTETASGTENRSIAASFSGTDTSSPSSETQSVGASASSTDTVASTESESVLATRELSETDASSAAEAESIEAIRELSETDTASSLEAESISETRVLSEEDSGSGARHAG